MPLKSFHGTTDPATPMGVPSFHRVQRLFLWIAAALCAMVVADNVSFKPMTGFSIKGADYLYLGVAGAFLVMAALRRDLGRKMAAPVVMIVFTVALIEAGLGVWSLSQPRRWPWYVWTPHYTCLMKPANLPGVAQEGRYSTNSLGIRGPEFSDGDIYRILCVGGSTTECLYLDDAKTWPSRLMRTLNESQPGVWVGSVGRSGTTAPHHVLLLERLPEARRADCWVVLCGINDFGQQFRGVYAETAANAFGLTFRYRRPGPGSPFRRPLQRNLYTFALIETLRKRLETTLRGANAGVYQDVKAGWIQEQQELRQNEQKVAVDCRAQWVEEYEAQLTKIVELARQQGKRLVFLTQPTLWSEQMDETANRLTLGGQLSDGRYVDNVSRSRGMERYNQAMRDLAARAGIELVDLAAKLPKTTDVFYDDCHFNENGALMVAAAVAEQVRTRELRAGVRK